ncbi:MAG: restriction endonuclease subunit S [Prosthecobacter sp.]|jgi:type I restriction enzyme S subunit|uniref:restriction endonuclease subunit S n=1 Tax=Prosthecobacter sp. TaxID=1965333 RepID=UPI0019ED55DC|nr:restriction endonuclease subunit S [Prosthecobacter sp.]MBE2283975.1 restriction endonuclease subunit S [Prosthecobacter sp.]
MSTTKTSAHVPKLRFPGFSDDAFQIKLGEVAKVTSGGTPSRQIPRYWDGQIPWVTTSLIDFNRVSCADEFITDEGLDNSSAKLFPKGTVIMALYGQGVTRGKVAILEFEAATNQACAAMLIHDRRLVNEYLFYDLQRRYTELRQLSNDGSQKNLSGDLLKNLEVTLPYVPEQQKVAAFLTAVDGRIEQLSRKKALLEAYKKGVMQQLFTQTLRFQDDHGHDFPDWEEKRLSQVATITKGSGISKADIDANGDTPCIRYGELYTDYGELIDEVKSRTSLPRKDLVMSRKNDVIIPSSGETHIDIARAACVIHDDVALGGDLNIMQTKQNGVFLAYYLNNACKHAIARVAQGSSVVHLYPDQLKGLLLRLPSLPEQTKIASFLSALDGKIGAVGEQMRQTQAWKKGLLQQMFV